MNLTRRYYLWNTKNSDGQDISVIALGGALQVREEAKS